MSKKREEQLERLIEGQNKILKSLAHGEELDTILHSIVLFMEKQYPRLLCSILILDEDKKVLKLGAAPSLPKTYNQAIDGVKIGPKVGSCGRAASTGKRVVVESIDSDPLWKDFRKLALRHDLHACWSVPIKTEDGEILGTFAMYYQEEKAPGEAELYLTETGAHMAAIAIEQKRREKVNLELAKQIVHMQKMEAIGLIASGLAHDLNNALSLLQGHLELIRIYPDIPQELKKSADIALVGSDRAAKLAKQMLGFSQRGKYKVATENFNEIVTEALDLFGTVVGSKIKLEVRPLADSPSIDCDLEQVQQVLTNLLINAKQAIGNSGKIVIEMGKAYVENPEIWNRNALPGEYVVVSITDDGQGIDQENHSKIFEPFFSTRKSSECNGLGLSVVFGIMQNHNGWVDVQSIAGKGSTFSLYFPKVSKHLRRRNKIREVEGKKNTKDRELLILIIDDEQMVLDVSQQIMERRGFRVKSFVNPGRAIEWFWANHAEVQAVLLDMIMPDFNGAEVFKRLKSIDPKVNVFLTSGYAQDGEVQKLIKDGAASFYQKPVEFDKLCTAISMLGTKAMQAKSM